MNSLQGAGLDAAVPGSAGGAADRYLPPGQSLDPGLQQRLVVLHHRDVVGFLSPLPANPSSKPLEAHPHRGVGIRRVIWR